MITLNMTAGNDEDVISVIRLIFDSSTFYISDRNITLNSTSYNGEVIGASSINIFGAKWNMENGGGFASARGMEFIIDKFNNANLQIDNFFPATSGIEFTGRVAQYGLVWANATTTAEITWLHQFYIKDYFVNDNYIRFFCVEISELNNKVLPYYSVQKSLDNSVDYYPSVNSDSLGQVLPLIYGSMPDVIDSSLVDFALSPCHLVNDMKLIFKLSSHKLKTIPTHPLYKFVDGLNLYAQLKSLVVDTSNDNTVITNKQNGAEVQLANTSAIADVFGNLSLFPNRHSPTGIDLSAYTLVTPSDSFINNKNNSTYVELNNNEYLSFTFDNTASGDISDSNFMETNLWLSLTVSRSAGNVSDLSLQLYNEGITEVGSGINFPALEPSLPTNFTLDGTPMVKETFTQQVNTGVNKQSYTIKNLTDFKWILLCTGDPIKIWAFGLEIRNFKIKGLIEIERKDITYIYGTGQTKTKKDVPINSKVITKSFTKIFSATEGRMFGSWIAGRSTYSEGSLITRPPYIIESIIRDEINTERDLVVVSQGVMEFPDNRRWVQLANLRLNINDAYNGATFHNATQDWSLVIDDYIASTNRLLLYYTTETFADNDSFYITNISPSIIDTDTFDVIGNTTDGTRKDWIFARCIFKQENSEDILQQLSFESHCRLFKSSSKYKLIDLDSGSTAGTFSQPLWDGGKNLEWELTPLENIYSDFILNFNYDPAKNKYTESVSVNKTYASDSGLNSYKDYCKDAEQKYRIYQKYEKNLDYIYDRATAILLLQKLVLWHTTRRIKGTYTGDMKTHVEYEEGDKVLIDHAKLMPTGKNNNAIFMISNKEIIPTKNKWGVKFEFEELP